MKSPPLVGLLIGGVGAVFWQVAYRLLASQTEATKKPRHLAMTGLQNVAPRPGLEPGTYGLTVRRSTN